MHSATIGDASTRHSVASMSSVGTYSPSHRLRKYSCSRSPPPTADPTDDDYFCIICLEPFEEQEQLYEILDCRHTFHRECAIEWFARNRSCPKCRFQIPATPKWLKQQQQQQPPTVFSAAPVITAAAPVHTPLPRDVDQQRRPVRPTWEADHMAPRCRVCAASFGFFTRRHHCRRCGSICCANCCPKINTFSSDRRCLRCSH